LVNGHSRPRGHPEGTKLGTTKTKRKPRAPWGNERERDIGNGRDNKELRSRGLERSVQKTKKHKKCGHVKKKEIASGHFRRGGGNP